MTKFNADFFTEHQRQLLGFINSNIGGVVRRSLCIPEYKNPLVKLTPNAAHVLLPDGKVKAVLFSRDEYALALHRNYKPLWELLHGWDMRLANRFMPAWNVGFDSYSSQPDETSSNDTWIRNIAATTNYGSNVYLRIGESNVTSDVDRVLIKFDFSSIATGNVSSAASLSLAIDADESSNTRSVDIFRVKMAWVESQTTWNIYSTGNSWETPGCGGSNDRDATASCSLSLGASESGTKTWTAWTLTDLDAMFGASPSYTNNGFLMKAQTESNDAYRYHSSGNATASNRPKMEITHAAGFSPQVIWF